MIYDELTSTQIGQLDKQIPLVLVLSATEQHGPHLPIATDRMIGEHFARTLHKQIPEKVLLLPTVSVGCSEHHMDFSGSLTLSHETFIKQVEDIVTSVVKHGFKNIILLNSHGGNQGVGQVLVEKLGYRFSQINLVLVTWWKLGDKEFSALNESGPNGTGHAGEFETSLLLLIAPHLVHLDKLEKGKHSSTFSWAIGDMLKGPKVSLYRSIKKMTSNGVYGDPTHASKEKGERITKIVVGKLEEIVVDLLEA
ncbi:creatininase family protein [Flagellimonas sp. S3867]|uniref:creatininase family protein n=1 Tax=Flagellimonas sp. S3867 TaxID=2768063 RepID=UPI0016888F2D|nr:creatininase family protein [Flagellimonas sp. S3867]